MAAILFLGLLLAACSPAREAPASTGRGAAPKPRPSIVVSTSILGSVVEELAGDAVDLRVLVPNGLDIHEWEPSARDVEVLMRADLVVINGLGLEQGLARTLERARTEGRRFFTATDHIEVRHVGQGEGIPSSDPDQVMGAADPHFWTDPVAMKAVALALATTLDADFGFDLQPRAKAMAARLDALDGEIAARVAALPASRRSIVTGHESLGYFAKRYGFTLVGALVPGLSSEAAASASWLAALKLLITRYRVPVIFTEVGTPRQIVDALSRETGAKAVPLATHLLPETGGYAAFERALADTIVGGLQ
jgi:zinc/manganese transport system substrate-binding protein